MYAKALEKPLGQRFAPLGKCYRTELLESNKAGDCEVCQISPILGLSVLNDNLA